MNRFDYVGHSTKANECDICHNAVARNIAGDNVEEYVYKVTYTIECFDYHICDDCLNNIELPEFNVPSLFWQQEDGRMVPVILLEGKFVSAINHDKLYSNGNELWFGSAVPSGETLFDRYNNVAKQALEYYNTNAL